MNLLAYFPMSSDLFCIEEGKETHDPFYKAHPAALFSFFFISEEEAKQLHGHFFQHKYGTLSSKKTRKKKNKHIINFEKPTKKMIRRQKAPSQIPKTYFFINLFLFVKTGK